MIQTLDQLKTLLRDLFGAGEIAFADLRSHQTGFMVPGTLKSTYKKLLARTEPASWRDVGSTVCYYADAASNVTLLLRRTQGAVLVIASVLSLHEAYLDEERAAHRRAAEEVEEA